MKFTINPLDILSVKSKVQNEICDHNGKNLDLLIIMSFQNVLKYFFLN